MGYESQRKLFKIHIKDLEPRFFQNKMAAKTHRDNMREQGSHMATIVMRGPDHWRGESFNVSKQTPKQAARRW